ncbi:MAG: hypothetical protein IKC63_03955 [Clostridia bacterium]|nr:hypothetical protein [Clostridia bacterium]
MGVRLSLFTIGNVLKWVMLLLTVAVLLLSVGCGAGDPAITTSADTTDLKTPATETTAVSTLTTTVPVSEEKEPSADLPQRDERVLRETVLSDAVSQNCITKDAEAVLSYEACLGYDCLKTFSFDEAFFETKMLVILQFTHGGTSDFVCATDVVLDNGVLKVTAALLADSEDTTQLLYSAVLLEIEKDPLWGEITAVDVTYQTAYRDDP